MYRYDIIKKKGKGEEDVYFSQQESKTHGLLALGECIKKLLHKMEVHSEKQRKEYEEAEEKTLPDHDKSGKDKENLKHIFEKYGIKDDAKLEEELKNWRKHK